jgi:predicted nucleic acid-binding protein
LASLIGNRLTIEHGDEPDIQRMTELVDTYADLPLGAVDAAVIAVAERLGATDVATLDHRHFTVVRPRHTTAFTLLP